MKQKLLTLFTLLLTVCSGAWGDDLAIDKSSSDWTSGKSINYTNSGVTISSGNNAKTSNHKWGGSTKVDKVYIQVSSTPFYIKSASANITKIEFIAWANNSSASNACDVKSSSTEDGDYSVVNSNFTATKDGATLASLTDINIAGYDAAGTDVVVNFSTPLQYIQIAKKSKETWIGTIKVWIADEGVKKPSFSPESGSSIIKSSGNVTITGATDNTVYYKWSTKDNEYGKSDGSALATGKDGQGTTTVNAPIPSTTGTWYLYAVAKDGEDYSDVVKATYTVNNPTYSISYANGGGSGEMSNTIVEEGEDQILPANTFTRDCYSFAGWVADVDVKISDATVTAGEIINDGATIEDVTKNITLTAQWTASYASGKYDFQTGVTIGTSPSKTVTTTDTDYAAFQIDNLYFSAMRIGYDDGGTSGIGDGVNFNGWKLKTKDATIKFVVESDKLVTIGIGSIGSGGAAKIDYTNLDGESKSASFSAGTNHNYLVKGGTLVTITHTGTNGKTVTLKKIFIQDYVPVTITAAGYATFSSTEKLDFTNVDGLTAYKATATSENSVTLEDVTGIVPANEGLLLKGAANTYYIPVSTADPTADVDGNLLQSTATAEYTVTGSEKGTAYVFGSLNDVVGFYKAAVGKKIGDGKSWLLVPPPSTPINNANFLSFVFGDEEQGETDGIKAVSTKVENGVRYNLAGQKVGADYKGIVIVNGKKFVVK